MQLETSSDESMNDRDCAPPILGNILGDALKHNDLKDNVDLALIKGAEKGKENSPQEIKNNIKSSAKKNSPLAIQKIENIIDSLGKKGQKNQ